MASGRALFRTSDKISIYYGPSNLDRLVRYDAVVIEPAHQTAESIKALHDVGTLVIAYVSVMEVHDEHPLAGEVAETEFLRSEKEPFDYIVQPIYNNRIVDMRSARWRGLLSRHVGELLTRHKYDGLFLDTIGDVEMPQLPEQMQLVEAAAAFVEQLRRWFPEAILIQNNGLELLSLQTARFLDGISWENPPIHISGTRHWVSAVADRLVKMRLAYNFRVFVLFEGAHQEDRADFIRGRSFADKYGFTAYFSPLHYQSFHN